MQQGHHDGARWGVRDLIEEGNEGGVLSVASVETRARRRKLFALMKSSDASVWKWMAWLRKRTALIDRSIEAAGARGARGGVNMPINQQQQAAAF